MFIIMAFILLPWADAKDLYHEVNKTAKFNIDCEKLERIHILSGGIPILLILAIDPSWPPIAKARSYEEEYINTTERHTSDELRTKDPEELSDLKNEFKMELVEHIFRLKELQIFTYPLLMMAVLYKSFSAEMLSKFMNIPVGSAEKRLQLISEWAFVKHDNETKSYWLHDLARDLVIEYGWPYIDPIGEERKDLYRKAIFFYNDLIGDIDDKMDKAQSERLVARKMNQSEVEAFKKLRELRREKIISIAHLVFYTFLYDYDEGLFVYLEHMVSNIWSRDIEANRVLDIEMNDAHQNLNKKFPERELKLRKVREKIVIDGEDKEALDTLDALEEYYVNDKNEEENRYYEADIELYKGIAFRSLGNYQESSKKLSQADAILTNILKVHNENNPNGRTRRIWRTLARINAQKALSLMHQGRYTDARRYYSLSMDYSNKTNLQILKADCLNDLGALHARLARFERARKFWEQGLYIREKNIYGYYLGLSYNVRGILEYNADRPHEGIKHSKKALEYFEDIKDARGIGLSCRMLGAQLSRIGIIDGDEYPLQKAEKYLIRAERIFSRNFQTEVEKCSKHEMIMPREESPKSLLKTSYQETYPDKHYLSEVNIKFGQLYTGWLELYINKGKTKKEVSSLFQKAKDCFDEVKNTITESTNINKIVSLYSKICDLYFVMNYLGPKSLELMISNMEKALKKEIGDEFFNICKRPQKAYRKI